MQRSIEALRELEAEVCVPVAQLIGPLDVWQPADHVGTQLHCLHHQICRLRVGMEALLRKSADLQLHQATKAPLCLEGSLELGELGVAVYVDEHPAGDNSVG